MSELNRQERNPWFLLIIIVILCAIGLFVFQLIGLVVLGTITGDSFQLLMNKIASPFSYPNYKWVIVFIQGFVSLGAFIVAPLFFIWMYEKKQFNQYFSIEKFKSTPAILTCLLVISFMMVNSIFIDWNANWQFPEFMSGFGNWAREKEDTLERLTEYITSFDSLGYFLFAFFVVAVLPGIGEELLFRGLIQKQIHKISGNAHIAIWVAAIFFSAFHMQFFGFIPRLLLGAFFGYLYVFSGSLWYAMLAHFVNNGFTLLMVYLYQNEITNYNIENTVSVPLTSVAISFIVGSILFYLFYKQVHTENEPIHE